MNHRNPMQHPTSPRRNPAVAALAAFLATLAALPVQAGIAIPNSPLQAGGSVPPNIMFILDTSGSMAETDLIDPTVDITGGGLTLDDFNEEVYTSNTLYYNPNLDYSPWRRDYGTPLTNTPYTAAYSSTTQASGSTTNLQNSVRTFYGLKPAATNKQDATQYYRFQIRTDGKVVRAERVQTSSTVTSLLNRTGLSAGRNRWVNAANGNQDNTATNNNTPPNNPYFINVPAGVDQLTITTSGSDADANLYVRFGSAPTINTNNCARESNNSNETCVITNPTPGPWFIGVLADNGNNSDAFSGVQLTAETLVSNIGPNEAALGCDTSTTGWGWRNCTYATPTGRTEAQERQNYATWYSFHRTRMKAAKAGISFAFSDLGEEFRVGMASLSSITSRIPVGTDGGLFRNKTTSPTSSNRSDWFDDMFSLSSNGYTPLRTALRRAGEYFKETGDNGPYGGTGTAQLACRQNFSILTTDGYWNNNDDIAESNFTGMSGDEDAGTTITGPNSASYTYSPVRPYSANQEGTLADVAMHYWKSDLRTNLDNIVPNTQANPAFWQHMVTFGISLGLKGNLDNTADLPAITAGTKNWGTVSGNNDEDPDKIDDLWHAAVNARGSFVAATDPQAFAAAIRGALATVVERTASGSNVSANSTALTSDSKLFQARYVSGRWYGELSAFQLTATGTSDTSLWDASAQIPAPGSRTILTWNGVSGAGFPTPAQSTTLNSPIAGVTDYIRGVRTLEESQNNGGTFRDRFNVLGDIVHSSPIYDKATDTVYVGANDGMLHAFDASNGQELFAYVPGNVDLASLKSYTNKNYAHAYFVDGPVSISSRTQTPSNSYLVGALGRGGKGVFALDVTHPNSIGTTDVLWDYSAVNHSKMGMVISKPIIARLNNGQVGVIVANGPNSTNDTAVLYILNITTGAVIAEIDTGTAPGYGGSTAPNGLSAPRGWDVDGNGTVDYVYAGDLRGNMWKFNLTSASAATWSNAAQRSILFTAVDSGGLRQPISGAPSIAIDPLSYNTWVFFGTGRYLNASDVSDASGNPVLSVQTWYGLIDGGASITGRAQLQQRTIAVAGSIAGKPVRAFEAPSTLDVTKKGWYIDLVMPPNPPGTAQGERMIGESAIVGSTLLAASIIPTAAACEPGGTGYINAVDAFTGASNSPNFFDVDGDGSFDDDTLTLGGAQIGVGSVNLGLGMPTDAIIAGSRLEAGGSTAAKGGLTVNLSEIYGRKSWREVIGD